jgi:phytoene dehydrogenase-like protein
MLIPSTLDDSLAPAGSHVASLFCQHVAPQLSDGRSWDDHRETPTQAAPHMAKQWGPPTKPITAAVANKEAFIR